MSDLINSRKTEHIKMSLEDQLTDRRQSGFDHVKLIHRALPEINLKDVDPSVEFLGKKLSFPFLISSITGGSSELVKEINRNLAIAAERCQVAMSVGSQRVMFSDLEAESSFQLRKYAPTTVLIGNIGAVQLNYGFGEQHCQKAVDVIKADGLFLHLNPLQEAVQPEGDTNFSGLIGKIADLQKTLSFPLLIKEVGCGICPADVKILRKAGIQHIDLSGSGGTSWSRIESHRCKEDNTLGITFQDWGISTVDSLLINRPAAEKITFIAGGGLRSGIDLAKSIILGARIGSTALPLLQAATESAEKVIAIIEQFRHEFSTAMFLLGAENVNQLHLNSSLILNEEK